MTVILLQGSQFKDLLVISVLRQNCKVQGWVTGDPHGSQRLNGQRLILRLQWVIINLISFMGTIRFNKFYYSFLVIMFYRGCTIRY